MQQRSDFKIDFLSVVIPSYKQEKTIVKDITNIEKTLKALGYKYEIVVVIDGFVDSSFSKLNKIKSSTIKVLGYEKNQGKGHAIRFGMQHTRGNVVGFI